MVVYGLIRMSPCASYDWGRIAACPGWSIRTVDEYPMDAGCLHVGHMTGEGLQPDLGGRSELLMSILWTYLWYDMRVGVM